MKLRRPRQPWLPMLACGLALASALAVLSLRGQRYEASSYFEDVALLRQVRQLDAQWELDAMKTRVGLSQNYDALVDPLDSLAVLPRRLTRPHFSDAAALERDLRAYQQALGDKMALMERFKSHNAVLRNSVAFLPEALADLTAAVTSASRRDGGARLDTAQAELLLDAAEWIAQRTLVYNEGGAEDKADEIGLALQRLAALRGRWPAAVGQRIDVFERHVRTVLREHAVVNGLLNRIAAAPTGARIDVLHARLREEQQLAAQQVQRDRWYLVCFAAALIGLLAYAAARLIRSHAVINRVNLALNQANEHLERRVQQRTAELTAANASLQNEIAERKLLQSRLVQSEKLASVGQLAAGVAHEINNPLGFISSNLGMLEGYAGQLFELLAQARPPGGGVDLDFLREDIPLLLAETRGGVERVARIVRDLSAFSRPDIPHDWIWADLHHGINVTLSLAMPALRPVADVTCCYGTLPAVQCLPTQLNQVVMSLLQNAGQAMGAQRGSIVIRTGQQDGQAWIEVEDNGCGIGAEVLPRIFDPFFSTRPIGQGAGLGLSLSYGIVQAHGGRIEVYSQPGQGSVFRVRLPLRQDAGAPRALAELLPE